MDLASLADGSGILVVWKHIDEEAGKISYSLSIKKKEEPGRGRTLLTHDRPLSNPSMSASGDAIVFEQESIGPSPADDRRGILFVGAQERTARVLDSGLVGARGQLAWDKDVMWVSDVDPRTLHSRLSVVETRSGNIRGMVEIPRPRQVVWLPGSARLALLDWEIETNLTLIDAMSVEQRKTPVGTATVALAPIDSSRIRAYSLMGNSVVMSLWAFDDSPTVSRATEVQLATGENGATEPLIPSPDERRAIVRLISRKDRKNVVGMGIADLETGNIVDVLPYSSDSKFAWVGSETVAHITRADPNSVTFTKVVNAVD